MRSWHVSQPTNAWKKQSRCLLRFLDVRHDTVKCAEFFCPARTRHRSSCLRRESRYVGMGPPPTTTRPIQFIDKPSVNGWQHLDKLASSMKRLQQHRCSVVGCTDRHTSIHGLARVARRATPERAHLVEGGGGVASRGGGRGWASRGGGRGWAGEGLRNSHWKQLNLCRAVLDKIGGCCFKWSLWILTKVCYRHFIKTPRNHINWW